MKCFKLKRSIAENIEKMFLKYEIIIRTIEIKNYFKTQKNTIKNKMIDLTAK